MAFEKLRGCTVQHFDDCLLDYIPQKMKCAVPWHLVAKFNCLNSSNVCVWVHKFPSLSLKDVLLLLLLLWFFLTIDQAAVCPCPWITILQECTVYIRLFKWLSTINSVESKPINKVGLVPLSLCAVHYQMFVCRLILYINVITLFNLATIMHRIQVGNDYCYNLRRAKSGKTRLIVLELFLSSYFIIIICVCVAGTVKNWIVPHC